MSNIYLTEDNLDDVARMLNALLTEVWIIRDRMAILESLLGPEITTTLDNHIPTGELAKSIEALRDRMVNNVVGAPLAARARGVDDLLDRAGMRRPG